MKNVFFFSVIFFVFFCATAFSESYSLNIASYKGTGTVSDLKNWDVKLLTGMENSDCSSATGFTPDSELFATLGDQKKFASGDKVFLNAEFSKNSGKLKDSLKTDIFPIYYIEVVDNYWLNLWQRDYSTAPAKVEYKYLGNLEVTGWTSHYSQCWKTYRVGIWGEQEDFDSKKGVELSGFGFAGKVGNGLDDWLSFAGKIDSGSTAPVTPSDLSNISGVMVEIDKKFVNGIFN